MPSELALNAYVLLGNTLHMLVHGLTDDQARMAAGETGTRQQLSEIYAAVEPLTPADILEGVRRLPRERLALLEGSLRWCLTHLPPEFDPAFGLPRDVAWELLPQIFTVL